MEYLDSLQILERKETIKKAFENLVGSGYLICRARSKQWRFFRACLETLFNGKAEEEFANLSKVAAAQYKFEVENKLRLFYQRPGTKHDFVFALVHVKHLSLYGLDVENYPVLADYCLLVREMSEGSDDERITRRELFDYIERVVVEGMMSEYRAYLSLPDIDIADLHKWFVDDGPAMREIKNVLEGVAARGWHLHNPMNPSTYRLLSIVVKKVTDEEAEVSTKEYWYLRWWDEYKKKYAYPYRETSQQHYILKKIKNNWLIFQNLRPAPRTSQPLRWNRRR